MNNIFKIILLVLLGAITLFSNNGCHDSPFGVTGDLFFTFDQERAQEEIPFPIVMPGYIAKDKFGFIPKPLISGPLKKYQTEDRIELRISYQVFDTGSMTIPYVIYEYNYPVSPPSTENITDLTYIDIGGVSVAKDATQVQPISYYFNQNGIYYVVESHDLVFEEAYKLIESIINQFT